MVHGPMCGLWPMAGCVEQGGPLLLAMATPGTAAPRIICVATCAACVEDYAAALCEGQGWQQLGGAGGVGAARQGRAVSNKLGVFNCSEYA
jgi:hypothetical protein